MSKKDNKCNVHVLRFNIVTHFKPKKERKDINIMPDKVIILNKKKRNWYVHKNLNNMYYQNFTYNCESYYGKQQV